MTEKKRRTRVPAKRRYKVRVISQPLPTAPTTSLFVNPILTPTGAISNASTQMFIVKSAAMSIPVTVYNLAKGKFERIPYPAGSPQVEENPSASNCNPPQLEATPNAPMFQVREDTPWPNDVPASMNLFKARADWSIPATPAPTVKVEKTEVPPQVAANPHAIVLPKPQNNRSAKEKCTWGLHCLICKKEEEDGTEDWNSDQ